MHGLRGIAAASSSSLFFTVRSMQRGTMASSGGGSSATPAPNSHRYALSQTLASDGSPVRSLCTIPTGPPTSSFAGSPTCADGYQLLCGSYDGLLTSHTLLAASGYMVARTVLQPNEEGGRHPHYVGTMLPIPCAAFGEPLAGGYITGCRDGIVRVFGPDHAPLKELKGHANNVSSLAWLELAAASGSGSDGSGSGSPIPPLLLSGSWDGTAKIWNVLTGSCLATLDNHENGVEVAGLPPISPSGGNGNDNDSGTAGGGLIGRLVTTSAGIAQGNVIRDHRVRIFAVRLPTPTSPVAGAALLHTVSNDHGGPIRSVAYDAETDSILTASNDGTVKIREGGTAQCHTTLAHPAAFASSDGQPPMLLDVACLGGGRYACTAEDGTCVIWHTQRNANGGAAGEPQTLDHPSSVWTVRPLPNGDIVTGCQDGFLRIYTTAADRSAPPEEVAALVDAVAASRTKKSSGPSPEEVAALPKWELCALTQGRSEGQVQMFNRGGGVAIAAQWSAASGTWIEIGEVTGTNENAGTIDGVPYDHVFPIEIEDPATGGVRKLRIGYNNGENQFVVAQRFIDANELPQYHLAQIADYIRQRAGADAGPATLGMEAAPAATAAAAAPAAAEPMDVAPATQQKSAYSHLPVQGYKSFATGATEQGLGKIVAKAREFNSTFTTNLTTEEIGPTLDALCQTLAETNRYHASKVSDEELAAVGKMVRHWDAERVFPALDLARLLAVHPDAATSRREAFWTEVVASSLTKCKEEVSGTATIAVPMLTMRLCANCFRGGLGSIKAVTGQLLDVLQCAEDLASSTNKNVRLAVSTVILNAASYGVSNGGLDAASAKKILSVVGTIVGSSLYESEGVVRALVALGSTLLIPGAGGAAAKEEAKLLHFDSMVGHAASAHGDKAKGVADEIRLILKS